MEIPEAQAVPVGDAVTVTAPLELGYAPPARKRSRGVWVVLIGLLTTAATLAGVYAMDGPNGTHVMGWYANYVIPAGAILVGLVASSGYALMAWWLGVKVRRHLLATIAVLLLASYFVAEYVGFRARGPFGVPVGQRMVNLPGGGQQAVPVYRRMGFWEYFHSKAVNWTWKKKYDSDRETPLGAAGYFFVLLGILGFCGAGLIAPLGVSFAAYCDLCERYMRRKSIALWAAGTWDKKPLKGQEQAFREEQTRLLEEAMVHLKKLIDAVRAEDIEQARTLLARDADRRERVKELNARLDVQLVSCPQCASGYLEPTLLTGKGKQLQTQRLGKVELTRGTVQVLKDGAAKKAGAA